MRLRVGEEINVDPDIILASSHGVRSIDVLKIHQPAKANWEYVSFMEGQIPKLYGADAVEIPGARALLDSIAHAGVNWAIVTSGTRPLVGGWLSILKLPAPANLITAEDVPVGKPDPECYQLGCKALKLLGEDGKIAQEKEVLVLEDSTAGIRAGKAAGCKVLAVVTTHTVQQVVDAGADWVVKDLRSLRIVNSVEGGGAIVEIRDALVRA